MWVIGLLLNVANVIKTLVLETVCRCVNGAHVVWHELHPSVSGPIGSKQTWRHHGAITISDGAECSGDTLSCTWLAHFFGMSCAAKAILM